MTRAEIKQQLHRYRDLKAEQAQIEEQLRRLTDPRIPHLTGMPKGSGGSNDAMVNAVAQRIALQRRYWEQLEKLAQAAATVEDMIESLSPMERRIFRCRYIEGKSWEAVCVAVGYSWRQTHNIHSAALDKLAEAYRETTI